MNVTMTPRLFLLFACCAVALAVVLGLPEPALAWGPGAHVVLSNWVMRNLGSLPPEVAGPILQFPGQFVHGALSPDVFIGKGSVAREGHSHNWDSGLQLLGRSAAPRWLSYSYGYLSHLAADTVAHNVFVPSAVFSAPGHGRLAHVYLEAQADRLLSWQTSQAIRAFHEDGSRRAARLLRAAMKRNAAFGLRRTLFQGSILFGNSGLWRGPLGFLSRLFSPADLDRVLDAMLQYSLRAIVSLLGDPQASPVRGLDPVGSAALARAMATRKPFLPRTFSRRIRAYVAGPEGLLVPDTELVKVQVPEILTQLPPVFAPDSFVRTSEPPRDAGSA